MIFALSLLIAIALLELFVILVLSYQNQKMAHEIKYFKPIEIEVRNGHDRDI